MDPSHKQPDTRAARQWQRAYQARKERGTAAVPLSTVLGVPWRSARSSLGPIHCTCRKDAATARREVRADTCSDMTSLAPQQRPGPSVSRLPEAVR
jgi:hypothetical protein